MVNVEDINKVRRSDGKQITLMLNKYKLMNTKKDIIGYIKEKGYKKVLHLGFAGHARTLREIVEMGEWFQKDLENAFDIALGIDICEEAVILAKELNPDGKYFCFDFIKDVDKIHERIRELNISLDELCIVMPDVLEHIEEPITFLREIGEKYPNSHICITVPNALSRGYIKSCIIHNKEWVNCDHKAIYSPFTLLKTCYLAGLDIKDLFFVGAGRVTRLLHRPQMAGSLGVFVGCSRGEHLG